ncbi:hypothetical protein [Tuwongella immobilis]|uniref:PEP-CTERM protein-sorting domain-containing protein n=1 Tax=Tuwongella immobilis TaxID=692036 RepID=A0A6C2YPG5_9BACT|nr:hypothetical protein [Tuwongella immobilis]VIP03191.1 unnamed protein product [Tuwongella immobilis]VTS03660.1 unnamed protein product [Tuwongella immobilis]
MRIPFGKRGMLLTLTGLVVFGMMPQSAFGFFWPGWPGSGIRSRQPLVTTPPGAPLSPPGNILPPEEEEPPGQPELPVEEPPPVVPEPATILVALTGLGCLAAWKKRKSAQVSE